MPRWRWAASYFLALPYLIALWWTTIRCQWLRRTVILAVAARTWDKRSLVLPCWDVQRLSDADHVAGKLLARLRSPTLMPWVSAMAPRVSPDWTR